MAKGNFIDRLKAGEVLLSDGAWGTELQKLGLEAGGNPEEWNITNPEKVKQVSESYYQAGADMGLTNTFNGTRFRQKHYGMTERVGEFNQAGAKLAKEVAQKYGGFVVASMGPTGEFVEPLGLVSEDEMYEAFKEQANAVKAGGADAVVIETIFNLPEMKIAIRAAKDAGLFVMSTMFFDAKADPATGEKPKDASFGFATMFGESPAECVEAMEAAGADVIGTNCGNGIENMVRIVKEMKPIATKPILVHSNAGIPKLVGTKVVYDETPEVMAAKVKALVEAGAQIIGGCCGTSPEHIRRFREELDKLKK